MSPLSTSRLGKTVAGVLFLTAAAGAVAQNGSTRDGIYTQDQAVAGATLYQRSCIE